VTKLMHPLAKLRAIAPRALVWNESDLGQTADGEKTA
jgi:hypothetical protein